MHDFTVTAAPPSDKKSDIPLVDYTLNAKTYRYIGTDDNAVVNQNSGSNQSNGSSTSSGNSTSVKKSGGKK